MGHKVFSSLSPCWFYICGGKWRKLLINVPYKCLFGMSDQGQTLDAWDDIQKMSTLRWRGHSYLEKSPPQPSMKSWRGKDIAGGISATILDHTDQNERYFNPTPILYVESSTWCGFFLSWPCVPTPNVRSDIWARVESYAIHMFLACRVKITFTSNLKLENSFLVLHCPKPFTGIEEHCLKGSLRG